MRTLSFVFLVALIIGCQSSPAANGEESGSTMSDRGPAESPDITIEVEGMRAGNAYLIGTFTDQQFRADSTGVDANGKMVFKKNESYPPGHYYLILPDQSNLQFLLDLDQTFTMKTKAGDLVGSMVVEGNIDNELLYQNLRFQQEQAPRSNAVNSQLQALPVKEGPDYDRLLAQRNQLTAEYKAHLEGLFEQYPESFFTSFKRAGQNPEIQNVRNPDGTLDVERQVYLFRTQLWDGVDFKDERLLRTPVISNKLKRYFNELTPKNPDSISQAADFLIQKVPKRSEYFKYFVNWTVINYEPKNTTLMDAQAVFVHMVEKYFTYDLAFWNDSVETFAIQQRAYEMSASLVGKKAPDVQAPDPSGQLRSIYELKSPYIIVYMYNPTCEHCAVETPKLVNFYRQWKPKGVEVFGIAIDTNDAEWKAYIAKNGMQWTNVFDPTNKSIYAKYFVDTTPEIYILDPNRTIIAKNLKVDQIAEVLERDMAKRN